MTRIKIIVFAIWTLAGVRLVGGQSGNYTSTPIINTSSSSSSSSSLSLNARTLQTNTSLQSGVISAELTLPPTPNPTSFQTTLPTPQVTENPTLAITENPTLAISENPTLTISENPTVVTSENPTLALSQTPSTFVSGHPSLKPTVTQTTSPSSMPISLFVADVLRHPHPTPSVSPAIKLSNSPSFSLTSSPTRFIPTKIVGSDLTLPPTPFPTDKLSASPTLESSSNPTQNPTPLLSPSPSKALSQNPTQSPTETPSLVPSSPKESDSASASSDSSSSSSSPSSSPTNQTPLIIYQFVDLEIPFVPDSPIDDDTITDWEIATQDHIINFYRTSPSFGLMDLMAKTTYRKQTPKNGRLHIKFDATLSYRVATSSESESESESKSDAAMFDEDPNLLMQLPFQTKDLRDTYVQFLRDQNTEFNEFSRANNIQIPDNDENKESPMSILLIVIIACVAAVLVLLMLVLLFCYRRRKRKQMHDMESFGNEDHQLPAAPTDV